jgi:hypothetical protein
MKVIIVSVLLCASLWAQEGAGGSPAISSVAEEHVRQLIASMPSDCDLLGLLKAGVYGDGVHHAWMDDMSRGGVKEARFWVQFSWNEGEKPWKVQSSMYLTGYCDRVTGEDITIKDPSRLKRIADSGLQRVLEEAALRRAKERVRRELAQIHWNSAHGTVFVMLTDDEWLPALEGADDGTELIDSDFTPLMDAARGNEAWLVSRLLKKGAEINAKNGLGRTALMYAAEQGNAEIVRELIRAGADPGMTDIKGESALSLAGGQHRSEIVGLLKGSTSAR